MERAHGGRGRPARGGTGERTSAVARLLVAVMVAGAAWALSPAPVPVASAEKESPSFERRAVAPLPASAPERVLAEPEANGSSLRSEVARDRLTEGGWKSSFDPGESVLDEEETSATRAVYDNADGTRTAVVSPGAVRFREGGEWRDIDLELVEEADGALAPKQAPSDVVFPSDPSEGMAVHHSSAGPIAVGLPSVVTTPSGGTVEKGAGQAPDQVQVRGSRGVASVVTPLSTGFRHDVVLADRAAAVSAFTVALTVPPGVTAATDGEGVAFRRGDEVLARYGGGLAFDAVGEETASGEVPVATRLVRQDGDRVVVQVSVDEGWLADPERVFPVTIDPTYVSVVGTTAGGADTYISAANPGTSMWDAADLRIGKNTDGAVYRSYLRFGLDSIPAGALIYGAELKLVNFYSPSCTPAVVRARLATSAFGAATTWNNQPGASSTVSETSFAMGPAGCPGGWAVMDATTAVDAWYTNPSSNLGLRLSADEVMTAGYKRFYSAQFGGATAPRLVVTYDRLAPLPTLASPADGTRVPTLTPTLTVNPVTDPDGEPVTYTYTVWTGDQHPSQGQRVRSAATSSSSWTVPAGALLDGVTYSWDVIARGGAGSFIPSTSSRTFTVDRRLDGGPAPMESAGPVEVNLVTGDASYSTSSPGVSTLGGGIAPSYTYHSTVQAPVGLTGSYYVDDNSNSAFDDGPPAVVRLDSHIDFDWYERSPFDALAEEQYLVRWTGFVTVPRTDTYYFGTSAADGSKVIVNGTTVLNRWPSASSMTPAYGTGISLTAGQTVPITMEMVDSTGVGAWAILTYKDGISQDNTVPPTWLTPSRSVSDGLSSGWDLDLGGSAPTWEHAQVTNDAITLLAPDGATAGFTRQGGGGFTSDDGSEATVALSPSGVVTVQEAGTTHMFASDGALTSFTEGAVGDSPAPTYAWTSTVSGGVTYRRITTVTDPVSQRDVTVTWKLPGSTCPSAPSGFDASPPTGALCQVSYWGGMDTRYFYKSGQLSRIVEAGGATTDFGYDGSGRLVTIRDPLAHDAVATGARADDNSTLTQIVYASGRVSKVYLPAPLAGAVRSESTVTYSSGATNVALTGAVNGSGYTRRVTYDASGRVTSDIDVAGGTTTTTWNPALDEEVWSTIDPTGMLTTHIYDAEGAPTDTYGPAPSAWFGSNRLPLPAHAANVPRQHVDLDGGVQGLAGSWFPNVSLTGEPTVTEVVADGSGQLAKTWSTSPTGTSTFSGRFTGRIGFGAAGVYTLTLTKSGLGRLFVDDTLVADGWSTSGNVSGSFATTAPDAVHRIRVEFASSIGTPILTLGWTPPGGSAVTVPGTALRPDYGNLTGATGGGVAQSVSYSGSGSNGPEDGAPASVTMDPYGAGLATSYTYEPDGTGWQRPLTRTLPAGNTWSYAHYGGTETRDNPCTPASDPAIQAGAMRTRTGPTAADGTPRVEELVYDALGRTVATRIGAGSWTCVSYDARGRPAEMIVPAFDGVAARTVTYDWAVGGSPSVNGDGNPLVTSVTDPVGTIETTVDLLGREVRSVDVWGVVAETTFDRAGRPVAEEVQVGGWSSVMEPVYGADSQVSQVMLDGWLLAWTIYDSAGQLGLAYFPGATGGGVGNDTLASPTYDVRGRINSMVWRNLLWEEITSDVVTYDVDGRVVDQVIDGTDPTPGGPSYAYDGAGRLVSAVSAVRDPGTGVPTGATRTIAYEFAAAGGCGALATAGANTNRTALKVDGVTTATYCYDAADRLTATTQAGYTGTIAYDARGNTTTIAGETRSYDGADRHVETTDGTTTVTYVRDALDRVVERRVDGVVEARYAHGGSSDSPIAVLDGSGALVQRSLGLPGGVVYSDDGSGGSQSWAYPNIHGDIAAIADDTGTKVGPTRTYDPYGNPETDRADTAPGAFDWGWLGQHQRPLEHEAGLVPTIEMGARQYDPILGRFLEVDPVVGGSCGGYEYACGDPQGKVDLDGRKVGPAQAAYCLVSAVLFRGLGVSWCAWAAGPARVLALEVGRAWARRWGTDRGNAIQHFVWMHTIVRFAPSWWAIGLGVFHELDGSDNSTDFARDTMNNFAGAILFASLPLPVAIASAVAARALWCVGTGRRPKLQRCRW